jgi:phenylacetate-CoA ligase
VILRLASLREKTRGFIYRYRPLPDYYGREFKAAYNFLGHSRQWNRERMAAYKLEKLKALADHAQKNVPYYRELFKRHAIDSGRINTIEDFSRIPILTKEILQNNLEQLKADNFASYKPIRTATSGTTGKITKLYRSRTQEMYRKAVMWRLYHKQGYRFRDKRVTIAYPQSYDINSPLSEYDRLENSLIINSYHIMAGRYDEVIDEIRRFRPSMIWAHPNLLSVLAEYALENGLPPIEIPLVGTFGEKVYPHSIKFMKNLFSGRYFEYYGNRENTIAAWGNCDGRFYEISEYCHFEINPGAAVDDKIKSGDLITTSLHNYAVPLLRYNSEDIADWMGFTGNESPYPMINLIGGRGKEFLLTKKGLTVPFLGNCLDKVGFDKIKKYQIVQVDLNEVYLRIIPSADFNRQTDEKLLLKYAEKGLGQNFKVRLQYEDEISFTKSGKLPAVVSKLALDHIKQAESLS